MSVLELTNVDKVYFGGYSAVKGVSCTIHSGDRLVIFGEHGAGKSSLLKVMSTLEEPTSGSITLDGKDISTIPTRELSISYATAELPLMRHRSVRANLAYPLSIRKVEKSKIDERVRAVSRIFGLDSILDERVRFLSESVAGRVRIARAFMRESDIYLMDNVLEHLTIADREEVIEILVEVMGHVKGAIVYATDRLDEARIFGGDNVLMLSHGYMTDRGALSEIYSHPNTLDTLRLLTRRGVTEMSREVRVREDGTHYVDVFGEIDIEIDDVYNAKEILVAMRPSDMRIERCEEDDEENVGIVTHIYHDVDREYAVVNIGYDELIVESHIGAFTIGDNARVIAENIEIFDKVSERRIIRI